MNIGRNDPCPCGSGKKYKKCCLSKEQNTTPTENNLKSQDLYHDNESTNLDEQAFLLDFMNSMRSIILDGKPHIKEYKKIRKLHSEISESMMDYYYKGKFNQEFNSDYVAQYKSENKISDNSLIFLESNFDLETSEGASAFQDMLMYKTAPNIKCITEDFIQKNRYRKPEKIEFLQSMLDSKLGLFEVTGVDSNEGYAYIKEVFTDCKYRLIDIGLSGNINNDDNYFYMRIITYHDISFGAGLNFVFAKTDPFIQDFISRHKKDYTPIGELVRFTELYNRYSSDSKGINIVVNTIK